jgi:hypothetical protein
LDAEDGTAGYMGVSFGGTDGSMAKKLLNIADVRAVFKKMGGKGVAQAVNRSFSDNPGPEGSFLENVLGGTN